MIHKDFDNAILSSLTSEDVAEINYTVVADALMSGSLEPLWHA